MMTHVVPSRRWLRRLFKAAGGFKPGAGGHPQPYDGRGRYSSAVSPAAYGHKFQTSDGSVLLSRFPPEEQEKAIQRFERLTGSSIDECVQSLVEHYESCSGKPLEHGLTFYDRAHDQCASLARSWSTVEGVSAAAAALSPGTQFDANMAQLQVLHHYLARNPVVTRDFVDGYNRSLDGVYERAMITWQKKGGTGNPPKPPKHMGYDNVGKKLRDVESPEEIFRLVRGAATAEGRDTYRREYTTKEGEYFYRPSRMQWQSALNGGRAVRCLMGEPPDKVLGGNKVRSFYNNIVAPGLSRDVTVDSHMVSAMLNRKVTSSSKLYGDLVGSTTKGTGVGGSYHVMAEIIYRGAKQVGMPPHVFQAVVWEQWRVKHQYARSVKS